MTEDLQTLILDDEERTRVDRSRTSSAAKTKRRIVRWRAAVFSGARPWRARTLTVLSFACLGAWGYVEHRRIESLRYELDSLRDQWVLQEPTRGVESSGRRPVKSATGLGDFSSSIDAIDRVPEELGASRAASEAVRMDESGVRPVTAAELVIRHRLADALDAYRHLAAARDDEPVYADVARILAIKLRCSPNSSGAEVACRR